MYVIREIVNCKPGKVGPMVQKFKALAGMMRELGHEPFRVLTDVSAEPFWTIVAETQVAKIDDFFTMEQQLMASEAVRRAMDGYHDLVTSGRREIYRVET